MTKTTGTIYEVLCPYCQQVIRHIWKLRRTEPSTLVRCKQCKERSAIDRVWLADGLWRMVTLVAPTSACEEAGEDCRDS